MAEVKFTKGSEEWMMFTDFWQLCQKYWQIELENEQYWEDMVKDSIAFPERYGNDKFAIALALAFINTQSEKQKQAVEGKE